MNDTYALLIGPLFEPIFQLATALAAVLAMLALWYGLFHHDPLAQRVSEVTSSDPATLVQRRQAKRALRQSGMSVMRHLVERFKLTRGEQAEIMADKLARAGWRSKDALISYFFAKLSLPLVFGVAATVIADLITAEPIPGSISVIIFAAGLMFGMLAPELFVRKAGDRRVHRIRKGLPDALDLLVICAEAGLSLDSAITRVGREMALANPDLADEYSLTAAELGFLPDRSQALLNLVKRTNLAELRSLVNSLQQTERYGTPLVQSLRVLSAEFRDDRMMRAEEKAAKLPAIMTVPMISFILPALFLILCGPAALRVMDTFAKM
jgi:tight adherence protein C